MKQIFIAMILGYVFALALAITGLVAFVDLFTAKEVFGSPLLVTFLGIIGAPVAFFSTLYLGYRAQQRSISGGFSNFPNF